MADPEDLNTPMPPTVDCVDVVGAAEEAVETIPQSVLTGDTETSTDLAVGLMTRYFFNNNCRYHSKLTWGICKHFTVR